jgi:hypothetical protein
VSGVRYSLITQGGHSQMMAYLTPDTWPLTPVSIAFLSNSR